MTAPPRRAPLDGVRVLDLCRFISGPYATQLLADQGAEVLKVEPIGGELNRSLGPMIGPDDGPATSAYFLRFGRNKKSLCLDLRRDEGRAVFERLVAGADVLVENFRPGVLDGMGFGWPRLQEINPRLVYATISGFGHSPGPWRDRGAFTPIAEALAAALIHPPDGGTPSTAGYPVGDIFPAGLAVAGIGMALYRRERDGRGARVDMAMYDAMLAMNERSIGLSAMQGRDVVPGDLANLGSAPSAVFRAKDGYVSIAVVGEKMWQRFCGAIDRPDWAADPGLGSGGQRAARFKDLLQPGIQDWISTRTRAEAVQALTEYGVPAAEAAHPREVPDSPQAQARNMILSFPVTDSFRATVVGNPIHFGEEDPVPLTPAPRAGQHTVEALRDWAHLDDAAITDLVAAGVVAQDPPPGGPPEP